MSQTIAEWLVAKGKVEESRAILRSLLQETFSNMPADVLKRIDATTCLDKLHAAIHQVRHIHSPEELQF